MFFGLRYVLSQFAILCQLWCGGVWQWSRMLAFFHLWSHADLLAKLPRHFSPQEWPAESSPTFVFVVLFLFHFFLPYVLPNKDGLSAHSCCTSRSNSVQFCARVSTSDPCPSTGAASPTLALQLASTRSSSTEKPATLSISRCSSELSMMNQMRFAISPSTCSLDPICAQSRAAHFHPN